MGKPQIFKYLKPKYHSIANVVEIYRKKTVTASIRHMIFSEAAWIFSLHTHPSEANLGLNCVSKGNLSLEMERTMQ